MLQFWDFLLRYVYVSPQAADLPDMTSQRRPGQTGLKKHDDDRKSLSDGRERITVGTPIAQSTAKSIRRKTS
jgi:hypothetical protein